MTFSKLFASVVQFFQTVSSQDDEDSPSLGGDWGDVNAFSAGPWAAFCLEIRSARCRSS